MTAEVVSIQSELTLTASLHAAWGCRFLQLGVVDSCYCAVVTCTCNLSAKGKKNHCVFKKQKLRNLVHEVGVDRPW